MITAHIERHPGRRTAKAEGHCEAANTRKVSGASSAAPGSVSSTVCRRFESCQPHLRKLTSKPPSTSRNLHKAISNKLMHCGRFYISSADSSWARGNVERIPMLGETLLLCLDDNSF